MPDRSMHGRALESAGGFASTQTDATADPDAHSSVALESYGTGLKAAVIGASGGIGGAFADLLGEHPATETIIRLSRSGDLPARLDRPCFPLDLEDETSIADAAAAIERAYGSLNLVIVATGILHDGGGLQPEKSWRALGADSMEKAYRINAVGPALVAKHFLPMLAAGRKTAFAAVSARVGSIGDNQLGGWYAYRASKAALNMIIRTLSIELARRNPNALCVGLHPGTVDTRLSEPFQRGVKHGKLFTPRQSAGYMLNVLNGLSKRHSGQVFAWDGQPIPG